MRLDDRGRRRASWPRRREGEPVTVLAHRGGRGPWRENTLEAFRGALAAGADGVELDVRTSADGVAVVHHDAEVEGVGPIAGATAAELPPWLPTLARALEVGAGAAVNVELKLDPPDLGTPAVGALADGVVPALVGTDCDVVVSSFWPEALVAASRRGGGLALALLVHPALDVADALVRAHGIGCAALHPHVSQVSSDLVARAHDLGLGVTTWTANDPSEVDRVLAAGVDGLITDDVAAVVAACRRP